MTFRSPGSIGSGIYTSTGIAQEIVGGRMPAGIAEVNTLVSLNHESLERLTHCLAMIDGLQTQPQYPKPPGDTPIQGGAMFTANAIKECVIQLESDIANICKIIGQL